MHEGEVEYEFNEGATNRPGQTSDQERDVKAVSGQLARLQARYGPAVVNEALKRATVTKGRERE